MSGCRSCSNHSAKTTYQSPPKAEKLQKTTFSGNPRYPRLLKGTQAIYTDSTSQIIVTVMADECDECSDCFTLIPQRILKDLEKTHKIDEPFRVSKAVGETSWKLRALL